MTFVFPPYGHFVNWLLHQYKTIMLKILWKYTRIGLSYIIYRIQVSHPWYPAPLLHYSAVENCSCRTLGTNPSSLLQETSANSPLSAWECIRISKSTSLHRSSLLSPTQATALDLSMAFPCHFWPKCPPSSSSACWNGRLNNTKSTCIEG